MKIPATLFAFALTMAVPYASAACGDYVTSDIQLTADLVDCPGIALQVSGQSDIVIDLNGFRVSSLASAEASIAIRESHHVRLVGGSVGGANTGVAISNSNHIHLEDLNIEGTDNGVYLWSVHDSDISFSQFTNNRLSIAIDDMGLANRVAVTFNHFDDNAGGVLIRRSNNNQVAGNTFRRTDGAVTLASSSGNQIENNGMFDSNIGVVISGLEPNAEGSHSNQIRGNKLYGNSTGLLIQAPKSNRNWNKYNEITKNAFRGGAAGIVINGPKAYRTEISENGFYGIDGEAIKDRGTRTVIQFNNCSGGC